MEGCERQSVADDDALVFVSYSRKDRAFVDRLVTDLTREAFSVWRDVFEIEPGDRVVDGIEAALDRATVFVLIVSAASIESRWVRHEWGTWMYLQLSAPRDAGRSRRLVPVVLGACSVPTFIKGLERISVDHDLHDYDGAFWRLVKMLRRQDDEPPPPSIATRPSGFESDPALKLASRWLRALLPVQFERIVAALDDRRFVSPPGPDVDRFQRCTELIELTRQRGVPWLSDLQEAVLEVRSPFSPFDGTSLQNRVARSAASWQVAHSKIVAGGLSPATFADARTPSDLQDAAILTWEGLAFRDGDVTSAIWMAPISSTAAAGLLLRSVRDRSGVLAIVRRVGDATALELWAREGPRLSQHASQSFPNDPFVDAVTLAYRVRGRNASVELHADGGRVVATISARAIPDHGPGHVGIVKFGTTAMTCSDLTMHVHRRFPGP